MLVYSNCVESKGSILGFSFALFTVVFLLLVPLGGFLQRESLLELEVEAFTD